VINSNGTRKRKLNINTGVESNDIEAKQIIKTSNNMNGFNNYNECRNSDCNNDRRNDIREKIIANTKG